MLARDGTRQHGIAWGACAVCVCACIALSSTEVEIIAASACAVELVHFRGLLSEMGLYRSQTPPSLQLHRAARRQLRCRRAVSARDPDHRSRHVDRLSCHRSWHVDRRYFKVRELGFEGNLHVEHVNTADNSADILSISDQAAQS